MRPAAITTVLLVALAVVLVAVVGLIGSADDRGGRRGDDGGAAPVARDTPVAQAAPLGEDVDVAAWASGAGRGTGVPVRALQAYGAAELAQRGAAPDCRLSWATLAGIGRVESDHGRIGRSELDSDGVARAPIVGVPLDGSAGVAEIVDTDGGRLDGDAVHDRAVGPMQFLPATWARFGADGDGDGVRDPQDLDDAARAAAAYLCAEDRDTASGDGWWDGVLTYNRSVDYARRVWAATDRYATAPLP